MRTSRHRVLLRLRDSALVIGLSCGLAPRSIAHEFWIEPSTFEPQGAATVRFSLLVGEDFDGRPLERDSAHLDRFFAVDHRGESPVVGSEGARPAGYLRTPPRGSVVVGYVSNPMSISIPANRFNRYLVHEGLDSALRDRQARGELDRPGKERFVRSAKTVLRWDWRPEALTASPLGLPFELIPVAVSRSGRDTRSLDLRVLFQGKPTGGVLVTARNEHDPTTRIGMRSDSAGLARLELTGAGAWLFHAVTIFAIDGPGGEDWQSYWASLTLAAETP